MHLRGAICLLCATALMAAGSDSRLADATQKLDRAGIRALLDQRTDVNATQVDGTAAGARPRNDDDACVLFLWLFSERM